MHDKEIKALAAALAKSLKTPEDLNQLCAVLKKVSIEAALGAELSDHLGYDSGCTPTGSNSRNGYSHKTRYSQAMENSTSKHLEPENAPLSPNWLKNTSAASPPWITRYWRCTPKA